MQLRNVVRRLSVLGCSLGTWLAASDTAWAAGGGSSDAGSWVLPYFIVVVSIGLGLAVACNPSRRRERAKPEEYKEKKYV